MVIPAKAAVETILDAKIGKLDDPPKMDFVAYPILANPVGCFKEGFPFLLRRGGKQKQNILIGKLASFLCGSNLQQKLFAHY
jgi:hypothetical protein